MQPQSDVYRELQEHLDNMPVGFPPTESGVEIRLLKHLFTPEEAEIALNLSAVPERLERIYRRVRGKGISIEALQEILDRLVEKGAIMGGEVLARGREGNFYSKAQFAIGMFEFQVNRLTREFAQDAHQYLDEKFGQELHTKKTSQIRTIPVNKSLKAEFHVGSYDNALLTIQNSEGPFAVLNCVCRQAKDKIGQPCKQTDIRETCIALEEIAQTCIDNGMGRQISREDTLKLLERAEETGMVLQPQNSQRPEFICCCCGCCCGVLTSAKKLLRPAQYFHTNYFAEVDSELCMGCETCLGRCQMEAISMEDSVASIDLSRCIGCNLCTTTCQGDAIQLKKKDKQTVPPKTLDALYKKITAERFGPWGTLKMMGKVLLRRKI
jgi:Pyruvate/2-oxoacid:ferredoxin oxidoreductase delta subunit